jgi:hypothetical protein
VGLAIACLVAILTILFSFDGRALAEYRSDLSITTMISVLATTMQGCVLFATTSALGQCNWQWYSDGIRPLHHFQALDDASRGRLGACRLLTDSLLGWPCLHGCSHYAHVSCRGRICPGVAVTGIFSHTLSWCFCVSLPLLWVIRHDTGTRSVDASYFLCRNVRCTGQRH